MRRKGGSRSGDGGTVVAGCLSVCVCGVGMGFEGLSSDDG